VCFDAGASQSTRATSVQDEVTSKSFHFGSVMITATHRIESGGPNEDRLFVERRDKQTIAIICDGAGNGGRGALAADLAIAELARIWRDRFVDWSRAFLSIDQQVKSQAQGGETTCVAVLIADDGHFRGASVGDSGALMLSRRRPVEDLTARQDRARLGSGRAHPALFKAQLMGTLLLASDGLLKYVRTDQIRHSAARGVDALIDSVRLKSGGLQDDVAVILLQ
jgi:serine/threonine protein phosphatase PrpC